MGIQIEKPMSPIVRIFFSRIFPLPFLIDGVTVFAFGTRNFFRAESSTGWPTTTGMIETSSVEYHTDNDNGGGTYHAHVFYHYSLNGTTYNGDRVAYGDYGESNPAHARHIVNRYPAGSNVTVYYMQDKPEECLLEPGIQGQTWFLPCFGALFAIVGSVMLVFLPRVMRKQYDPDHPFDETNKGLPDDPRR